MLYHYPSSLRAIVVANVSVNPIRRVYLSSNGNQTHLFVATYKVDKTLMSEPEHEHEHVVCCRLQLYIVAGWGRLKFNGALPSVPYEASVSTSISIGIGIVFGIGTVCIGIGIGFAFGKWQSQCQIAVRSGPTVFVASVFVASPKTLTT